MRLSYGAQAVQSLRDIAAVSGPVDFSAPAEPPAPTAVSVYSAVPGFNVYFLSVGQGDAEYIEFPDGRNALIDGGPSASATSPLATFLSGKGIKKIDYVVLTHPHSDHYNGLPYVFSNFTVGAFFDTRMDNTGGTGDNAVRDRVAALGVKTFYPAAGEELAWSTGGVRVKVLNSCSTPTQSSAGHDINNSSIVLKISYKNASVLLTGDAQSDVEASLVQRYGAELKADALKVAHHGSKYSSTEPFLNAVKPSKAYVEVGKNNYGHPTQSALDRLKAVGAAIYRTDLDGTLEYSVNSLLPPQLAAALP